MIIVLAGTGKTTFATQLAAREAIAGRSVCLVDASYKRHASRWAARRLNFEHAPRIDVQPVRGAIGQALRTLERRYDVVIVDPADASRELATALLCARLVVVPFAPSQFDLEQLRDLEEDLTVSADGNPELIAVAVPNQCETNWTRSHRAREARAWLADCCPRLASTTATVSYRPAALQESAETGLSVFERSAVSAQKAADQLALVANELDALTRPTPTITETDEEPHGIRHKQQAG